MRTVGTGANCGTGNSGLACTTSAPENIKTTSQYNTRGQLTRAQTAPNGAITYSYLAGDPHSEGWLGHVTDPAAKSVTFAYDNASNVTAVWDRNAVSGSDLDDASVTDHLSGSGGTGPWRWPSRETKPETADDTIGHGARTTWTRDAHGNVKRTRSPRGSAAAEDAAPTPADDAFDATATFDGRDRQTSTTTPTGTTDTTFNSSGNPTRIVDAEGHSTGSGYDGAGRATDSYFTRGDTTDTDIPTGCHSATTADEDLLGVSPTTIVCASSFTYSSFDDVIEQSDPTGTPTTRTFDRFGRIILESHPGAAGTVNVGSGYDRVWEQDTHVRRRRSRCGRRGLFRSKSQHDHATAAVRHRDTLRRRWANS